MNKKFISLFAEKLDAFIKQKQALGYTYEDSIRILHNFDKMCHKKFPDSKKLSKEICLNWAIRYDSESNNTFLNRLMPIREFSRYLIRCGEEAFILPTNLARKSPRFIPHIYTREEILKLWDVADKIQPVAHTLHSLILPLMLRMIYCCGLRPGEARKLRLKDVDLAKGSLYISESKGHKDRIVWMSDDLLDLCISYNLMASALRPNRELFFPSKTGEQYIKSWLEKSFRNIRRKAGVIGERGKEPRIYDFRHTFATHRLYQWMHEGKDLAAILPYLSTYMGHKQLSDTYYYIHFVPGMLESMAEINYSAFENLLPEVTDYE